MGLEISAHSGYCCGMFNIFGFSSSEVKETLQQLDKYIELSGVEEEDAPFKDHVYKKIFNYLEEAELSGTLLLEAILTDYQLPYFEDELIKRGFKKVNSFVNPNSGNTCHIFHRS